MDEHNQLSLFQKTINHKYTNRFLFYARFTPALDRSIREAFNLSREADLYDHFQMFHPRELSLDESSCFDAEKYWSYYADYVNYPGATLNEIGVLQIPGSMYHFTKGISPLRNVQSFADIRQYPYPRIQNLYLNAAAQMRERVNQAHLNGQVASCWIGHMYECAWAIRGYEQFLMDMIINREWCEYILDRFLAYNVIKTEAAATAGADVIRTGDDVANQRSMMFSPELWRDMMKPRWAEVFSRAKAIKPDIQIWYHSDGNIEEIIPDLIDIGVTILNPVQPECMDTAEIKRRYGDKIVLDGSIGTQSVMPFGKPEDIRQTIRDRKRLLGYDGALILSPTHVLEPEVPIDNIIAFIDEASRTE
jgi:uroporphyrinogen decarboxylase